MAEFYCNGKNQGSKWKVVKWDLDFDSVQSQFSKHLIKRNPNGPQRSVPCPRCHVDLVQGLLDLGLPGSCINRLEHGVMLCTSWALGCFFFGKEYSYLKQNKTKQNSPHFAGENGPTFAVQRTLQWYFLLKMENCKLKWKHVKLSIMWVC